MRQTAIAIIIIVALALTLHFRLFMDRQAIPYADASDSLLSLVFMQDFISESVHKHHQLPLWDPRIWSGTPLIGNPQAGLFYPPAWVFMLLSLPVAMKVYYILHTALAGVFMYFLSRQLKLAHGPSLIAAVIFMTTGSVYAFNVQHFFSNFILWLPGVILFYRMSVEKRNCGYAFIAGLLAAVQFMGSHPQLFVFSMIFFAAFCATDIFTAWRRTKSLRTTFSESRYAVVTFIVAIGLSAPQIIGMIEFSSLSTRISAGGLSFAANQSLGPDELLSVFLHPLLGGGVVMFIGLIPLFFAQAALFGKRTRELKFFFAAAVISMLFALGKYSPLFYIAYYLIPGFKMFRNPYYATYFFCLSLAPLCAYGAQYLFIDLQRRVYTAQEGHKLYSRIAYASIGFAIGAVVYFVSESRLITVFERLAQDGAEVRAGLFGSIHIRTGINMMVLGGILLVFLCFTIFLRQRSSHLHKKAWKTVLVSLLVLELVTANVLSMRTARADEVFKRNELVNLLEKKGRGWRVLNLGGDRILCQTLAGKYGIELADGYDPLMLNDYQAFMNSAAEINEMKAGTKLQLSEKDIDDIGNRRPLDILSVRYILSPRPAENADLFLVEKYEDIEMYCHKKGIVRVPEIYVYENPNAVPRAFITSDVRVRSRDRLLVELEKSKSYGTAFLENPPPHKPLVENGEAEIRSFSPNRISVHAELDRPGLLVLSEIWYPGWKAYVDGEEEEILRANYLLRAVSLGPGSHDVDIVFKPKSYVYGRYITLATLAVMIIAAVSRKFMSGAKGEGTAHN